MLDSKSKQILSFLKPYAEKNSRVCMDIKCIDENIPTLSLNDIKTSLDYLENLDYLKLLKSIGGNCAVLKVNHKGINFEEFDKPNMTASQMFNIHSVNNSAFGNNGDVTINNGSNLEEIRALISSKPIEDQEELNKLINTVEVITESGSTVSKGFLSKFSDVLAKHSDIAIAIGSNIIKWLTSK